MLQQNACLLVVCFIDQSVRGSGNAHHKMLLNNGNDETRNINIIIWYAFAIYFVILVIHHVASILILIIKLILF